MASAESLVTCSICLDRFKQPKVLPCQHTFCLRPCLERLVEHRRISCPQCRACHPLPLEGVEGFPNNLTIVNLLELPQQPTVSSDPPATSEFSCQECKATSGLFGKCLHCDKALCHQCLSKHSEVLKAELNESISKVSTRCSSIAEEVTALDQIQQKLSQNERKLTGDIERWYDRCVSALQAKKRQLLERARAHENEQKRVFDDKRESLEMDFAMITSFRENAEQANRLSTEAIAGQQKPLMEIIQQSKNHLEKSHEEIKTMKYAKFRETEANYLLNSICEFEGINVYERPVSAVTEGATAAQPGRAGRYYEGPSVDHLSSEGMSSAASDMRDRTTSAPDSPVLRLRYRNRGRVRKCFGGQEIEADSLKEPRGISVTPNEEIVVSDTNNHRIQVYDSSGNAIRVFGHRGEGNGQFDFPWGVCVTASGQFVVADRGNNRIQVFDNAGRFINTFGHDKLSKPRSVAVNGANLVFVADESNTIGVFSLEGNLIRTFGESWLDSFGRSKYIAVTPDNKVIVSEWHRDRIGIFEESGQLAFEIGTGAAEGQFKYPRGVASDADGNIVVADSGNHIIQVFDKYGEFKSSFGSEGSQPGQMTGPDGVAVLRSGDIIVSDTGNDRIQIFTPSGTSNSLLGAANLQDEFFFGGSSPFQTPHD